MKIILLIIFFLFCGAFLIVSNENIHLNKKEESEKFALFYYNWISNGLENARSISAHAVNLEWFSKNSSNFTK
ncbi:MAG: hypothetical protein AABW65_02310 [Nanoarchaeota archaeon]